MMMNGICLIAAVLIQGHTAAQITWRRSFGGHGTDQARTVIQTSDEGYIVAGSTGSFGSGGDVYVLKLDAFGEREWSAFYGGDQVDEASAIVEVENGYLIAGLTASPSNGGYDGLLMRITLDGTVLWRRSYGGPDWDMCNGMDVGANGVFLIGTSYEDQSNSGQVWVVHTDLDGEQEWNVRYGGEGDDAGHGVRSTEDGGCVVVGSYEQTGNDHDAYLVKLDGNGTEQFSTTVGTDSLDIAYGVDRSADGSFVLCGTTNGYEEYSQILVARVSASGELLAQGHIGQGPEWDGRAIHEKPDGTLAVAASTSAFGFGGKDMFLLWTDADCQYLFGTTFGGSQDEVANSLDLTADGGHILAGYTESTGSGPRAVFVVKTGADGFTLEQSIEDQFDPVSVQGVSHPREMRLLNTVAVDGAWWLEENRSPAHYRVLDASGRCLSTGLVVDRRIPASGLANGAYLVEVITQRGSGPIIPVVVLN